MLCFINLIKPIDCGLIFAKSEKLQSILRSATVGGYDGYTGQVGGYDGYTGQV